MKRWRFLMMMAELICYNALMNMQSIENYALPKNVDAHDLAQICQMYGIQSLYLFGSYSRGEARPDSDIDLVAKFGPAESRFCNIWELVMR